MSRMRWTSLLSSVFVGFVIILWFVQHSDVPGGSGAFESTAIRGWRLTALTAAYGFMITLFGVALGAAYRRLVKMRAEGIEQMRVRALVGEICGSVDFMIALVGAPIVYGLLWQSLADISFAGLTVIALQNGFASHAILDQFVASTPSNPRT